MSIIEDGAESVPANKLADTGGVATHLLSIGLAETAPTATIVDKYYTSKADSNPMLRILTTCLFTSANDDEPATQLRTLMITYRW